MTTTPTLPPLRGRGRLPNVVAELRRQVDQRVDFVLPVRDLTAQVAPDGRLHLVPQPSARDFLPAAGLPLLDQALAQYAARLHPDVPLKFLRAACKLAPQRIADYLTGVMHDAGDKWFLRCLDGHVRAVLSDRYRVIESLDVVQSVLHGCQDLPVRVLEASVSDSHVRIKLVNPAVYTALDHGPAAGQSPHTWLRPDGTGAGTRANQEYLAQVVGSDLAQAELQAGADTLWPTVTFGNSDTGHGSYHAQVGILQAACFNLATIERKIATVHIGERMDEGIFTAETVQASARAMLLRTRDLIAAAFDSAKFRELVALCTGAARTAVAAPATALANVIRLGPALADGDLDALVRAYAEERPTVYGVGQAVARLAQDKHDPEVAADLERLAGEILTGKHTRAVLAAPATH